MARFERERGKETASCFKGRPSPDAKERARVLAGKIPVDVFIIAREWLNESKQARAYLTGQAAANSDFGC